MMGTGSSGFAPGLKGMPRYAKTALLGGARWEHVMNFIALISVFVAIYCRIAKEIALIYGNDIMNYSLHSGNENERTSSGVNGSSGCLNATVTGSGLALMLYAMPGTAGVASGVPFDALL